MAKTYVSMSNNTKISSNSKNANQCEICKKIIVGGTYKFRSHLYQHKAVESRFKCTYCLKEFFRKDIYQKHMKSHLGDSKEKVFICDYCDRSFVNKRNLIGHMKVHDDSFVHNLKYKCKDCGVSYYENRLLKYHIRKTHYNFQDDSVLPSERTVNETWIERVKNTEFWVKMTKVNNNMITIKKFDVIKDEGNEKSVVKKEDLKKQLKEYFNSPFALKGQTHYTKAICDYCNKEMLKKSIRSHIRERHLKIRNFKCDECNRSFKRHYQLVNHNCGKVRQRQRKNKQEI